MWSMFMPYFIAWVVLAIVLLVIAMYRRVIVEHEDDTIHIADERLTHDQEAMAKKVSRIDFWGKLLTIILIVWGVVMGAIYIYLGWAQSGAYAP